MIKLILTGGLGNQMFEYAAAKSLALRLGKKLTIDLYALNKTTRGTKRELELDVFDLDLTISSSYKTRLLVKAFPLINKNRKLFYRILGYFRDYSAIVYQKEFEQLDRNTILHGHFQNPRYFEKYSDEIRKYFSFNIPLKEKNKKLKEEIEATESVSIHIRRGDYIADSITKSNFALCQKEYYQEAILRISKIVQNPHFYIFSEDFEWIHQKIDFADEKVSFVNWNTEKNSYIDMQLMSLCKHNIIANSSFSWWAAWLNNKPTKKVYAPSEWFSEKSRNDDLINFYPPTWEII